MHLSRGRHAETYIRASVLHGFAELAAENGVHAAALLERAGLPAKALTDADMLISWRRLGVLMETAASEWEQPSLGLRWALAVSEPFPNVGPVGLLANFTGTVGEWLRVSMQYWRYHTNAYALQLIEDDGTGEFILRFHHDHLAFPPRQQMEYTLGSTCEMARVITGFEDSRLKRINFQHARPLDLSLHERVFRCPVVFEAAHNEIVFDPGLLDYSTRGRLKPLRALFDLYIRYRIRHMPLYDQSMRATVAAAIPAMIGTGVCTLEAIAQSLALSPKKLQRLLAQENTAFSDILEEVRQTMATRLLAETDVPVASIAGLLGYASNTPFTFAFKRWKGMSPREYRAMQRGSVSGGDADGPAS